MLEREGRQYVEFFGPHNNSSVKFGLILIDMTKVKVALYNTFVARLTERRANNLL